MTAEGGSDRRAWLRWIDPGQHRVLAALALLGGVAIWALWPSEKQAANVPRERAVPVRVAQVLQHDVPQITNAIGTVQSLHAVTIHSQIDGILQEILFEEGALIERGQHLATIDDRAARAVFERAQAELARVEAQLAGARADLERFDGLRDSNVIARQTIDRQAALVQELEAGRRASEAALQSARVQLSHTRIVSPVSGRAGLRNVDPGNFIRATDVEGLATVTQIDPISIVFTLPQERLARIRDLLQAGAPIPVTARDRDAQTVLAEGELTTLDNLIDPSTGTMRLRAVLENPHGALWPGQFVTVEVRTGLNVGATVAPAAAIRRGQDRLYVFRVAKNIAEAVPVELAYENDRISVVLQGLSPGDIVVTDGQSLLKPGSLVRVVEERPPQGEGA